MKERVAKRRELERQVDVRTLIDNDEAEGHDIQKRFFDALRPQIIADGKTHFVKAGAHPFATGTGMVKQAIFTNDPLCYPVLAITKRVDVNPETTRRMAACHIHRMHRYPACCHTRSFQHQDRP